MAHPPTAFPPGPPAVPFIGGMLQLRDPLQRVTELSQRYGGLAYLGPLGRAPVYLVTDPALLKQVLVDKAGQYKKGKPAQTMRPVLGDGLLLLEGEPWKHERRLVQPAFHRARIAELAREMTTAAQELVARWEAKARAGELVDLRDEMLRLTMRLTVRALFHADITGQLGELVAAWQDLYDDLSRSRFALASLPRQVPTPANRRYTRAMATIDRVLYGLIRDCRARNQDDGSVLAMLVHAKDEEQGDTLSDHQLRDELMTLFVGGYETSSNALAFTFAMLALHPEVERAHQAELAAVLGDRAPEANDLPQLPLNRAVIEETMRLYPPSWMITREALADDVLNGYPIPAGAQLLMSSYATHHDPRLWPNPEAYDPRRFLPPRPSERPRYSYFPFGGGPRLCLGDQYALTEMQLVLATVMRRLRVELAAGTIVAPKAALGLRPLHPLRARLHLREAAQLASAPAPA